MLSKINHPNELKKLSVNDLPALARDIRSMILNVLSESPGHLGANLGVVELTIALHYFFSTPKDALIWDVGHQSYPHKLLTGRKKMFSTVRKKDGISGFPSRKESIFDEFGTGHSSTSISAITGIAQADYLNNINNEHIAIIGDASIVSGMSLEALNYLGATDLNVLIILNDNTIGIDPSVGGLKNHFTQLEDNNQNNIFTDFGLEFIGSVDGHDFNALFEAFNRSKTIKRPKILHVKTTKGKGFQKAEEDQIIWHAPGLFDLETGKRIIKKNKNKTFQDVFGETMLDLLHNDYNVVAVTPAMLTGSNLEKCRKQYPDRVIDVGIAEQHAVTFCAGLATRNMTTYCVIYSTFLQRAYDQVIHDVALQNIPVIFCIDRAGIAGSDGATHHGYFDIAFMREIPNMIVSSPKNGVQFVKLLHLAKETKKPFAIRFPKAELEEKTNLENNSIEIGKANEIQRGQKIAILTHGSFGEIISNIIDKKKSFSQLGFYDFPFVKPLDNQMLLKIFNQYSTIITLEDGIINGGFGSAVLEYASLSSYKGTILRWGFPDDFITHGTPEELYDLLELSPKKLENRLNEMLA